MRKFSSEIELEEQIEAAKEYYAGPEKKILDLPPHLVKKYFIKKKNPNISNASNDSSTKDLFEGHQNYKELVNELNYPRGNLAKQNLYKIKKLLKEKEKEYKFLEELYNFTCKMDSFGCAKGGAPTPTVAKKLNKLQEAGKKVKEEIDKLKAGLKKGEEAVVSLSNQIDTWYKNPYYGRVCNKNNLIYTSYYLYRNISGTPEKSICVFDFVATAFDNMKEKYSKIVKSPGSKYLKDLQAVFGPSSTISLEEKYVAHLDSVYDDFMGNEGYNLRYSLQTKDYDSFRKTFVDYLINNKKIFTFAGFAESLGSNIYDSYLAFDILETPPSNPDSLKLKFLEDPNYPAYARAAKETGFAIDPNKPWRLIADFSSAEFFDAIVQTLTERKDNLVDIDNYITDIYKNIIPTMGWFGIKIENYLIELKPIKQKPLNYFDEKTKKTRAEIIDGIYDKIRKELEFFKGLSKSIRIKFNYDFEAGGILDAQGTIEEEATTAISIIKDNYLPFFKKLDEELDTKKGIINSSISALSFANTDFVQLTTQNIYENVYYNVYDYMFFSYVPIKIVEFYNRYVEKYPFYGTISFVKYETKTEKEATSFNKSFRQKRTLEEEKVTKKIGIINDLYKREYLRIYARLRNSENYDKLDLQEMKVLIADLETLFHTVKKVPEASNKGLIGDLLSAYKKKLKTTQNRMIQLTELAMGTPYTKNKVPGYEEISKSSIFALKKTWENKKSPNLLRKRLCISPEEPLVPRPEPGCEEFPVPLTKQKKPPAKPKQADDDKKEEFADPLVGDIEDGAPCKSDWECKSGKKCYKAGMQTGDKFCGGLEFIPGGGETDPGKKCVPGECGKGLKCLSLGLTPKSMGGDPKQQGGPCSPVEKLLQSAEHNNIKAYCKCATADSISSVVCNAAKSYLKTWLTKNGAKDPNKLYGTIPIDTLLCLNAIAVAKQLGWGQK
jgi:hypothetical protein